MLSMFLNHLQTPSGLTMSQLKRKCAMESFVWQGSHRSVSLSLRRLRYALQGKTLFKCLYWKLWILVSLVAWKVLVQAAAYSVVFANWRPWSPSSQRRKATLGLWLLGKILVYILLGPRIETSSGGSISSFNSMVLSGLSGCQLLEMDLLHSIGMLAQT